MKEIYLGGARLALPCTLLVVCWDMVCGVESVISSVPYFEMLLLADMMALLGDTMLDYEVKR